uniref:BHLH domain-containing protein n=1 Tax=Ditylenchus dipsaci TaxID=166011 RepID=A0A915D082_9BILA
MLPKCTAEDMKLNKGTILKASCDYIRQLQQDRELMIKQQQDQQKLEEVSKYQNQRIKLLEQQLEKKRPQCSTEHLANKPFEPNDYQNATLSPSQTPSSNLPSAGFMNQLQEMQITSPRNFHPQHQHSPTQQHHLLSNGGIMVGSLPADHRGLAQNYINRNFFPQSPIISSSASLSEYSTPNTTWSPINHHHQSMLLNNGSTTATQNTNYGDLTMEDLTSMQNNPLLQGDPMIGSLAGAQMSPEIQWDMAGFSPDAATGGNHGGAPASNQKHRN